MNARSTRVDTGIGVSFFISTVIHLAVFLLLSWYGNYRVPHKTESTYYVDVVNLPVAAPRLGSPAQKGSDAQHASSSPVIPASPMTQPTPSKQGPKAQIAKKPLIHNSTIESSSEFNQRMAKLEQAVEAKEEETALTRLREKIRTQGSGRAGMPGGSGKEAGSDYMAYVKSRLKDAFQRTINHNSPNPEMVVRLFIDTNGKLSRKKPEHSSGDRAFEISVSRAIDAASAKFTPPPDGKMFEGVFIFKREGIAINKP